MQYLSLTQCGTFSALTCSMGVSNLEPSVDTSEGPLVNCGNTENGCMCCICKSTSKCYLRCNERCMKSYIVNAVPTTTLRWILIDLLSYVPLDINIDRSSQLNTQHATEVY